MHEVTLVKGIVFKALAVARARGIESITQIRVAIGVINAVDNAEIEECFRFLKGEIPQIKDATIDVISVAVQAKCEDCH